MLDLTNAVLNGGSMAAVADDAVHVVAYFGDTTGNGNYSGQDASRVSQLAVGLGTGIASYKLLDPTIVADISDNGSFSSLDASRLLQAAVVVSVPEIPALPFPAISLVQGGPDPKLSIPTTLVAAAGEGVSIPVQIDSIVDLTGNGMESADLVIYYDATRLDVSRITLGELLQKSAGSWTIGSRIDSAAGRIFISLASSTPLEGIFQGELVQLHALVRPDAPPGAATVNLAAGSRDPARFTQLNEGYLTLIPAPTDAADDPGVDGLVTVKAMSTREDTPSARLIYDRLVIMGTDNNDFILVSMLSENTVRVRETNRVLGDFATPTSIIFDGLLGNDHISVAPGLQAAWINTPATRADRYPVESGGARRLGITVPHSGDGDARLGSVERIAIDVALLRLLDDWIANVESTSVFPRRLNLSRR